MIETITEKDKEAIRKYFGMPFDKLDREQFKRILKELRAKYHPDNFAKFGDEAVHEMATERFQLIETLAQKIEAHLSGNAVSAVPQPADDTDIFMHRHAVFAANELKVEVLATDKDLKYRLFGTRYRWLQYGDKFKIPDTGASIIIDENHSGIRVGYQESIRMYLTFEREDSIEKIVEWLYPRIATGAQSLMIAGEKVAIEPHSIFYAIRKRAFLGLELPEG